MANTYTPKNILLTGGAGFIGSHVVLRLMKDNPEYNIVVLDKLEYCSNLRNLSELKDNPHFKFAKGDIASVDLVTFLLQAEKIDTIMNFAAQTHVDNSFGNSLEFTTTNVYGTHVLLEAARISGQIKRFIHVSTDEVYGEMSHTTQEASHEHATLEPTNPYAASKAAAEMLCKAYNTSYQVPIIVTRGNNVYGPHQYPEKLIPKFCLLAMHGRPMPIHGDGSALRSFLYVTDVAAAFSTVLHKGTVGETYNIGTTHERSTNSVAADICKCFNLDAQKTVSFVNNRLFQDRRYFISEQKLAALGWAPQVDWDEGLATTIEWYRNKVFDGDYWPDYKMALVAHPMRAETMHESQTPPTSPDPKGKPPATAAEHGAPF